MNVDCPGRAGTAVLRKRGYLGEYAEFPGRYSGADMCVCTMGRRRQ